MLTKERPGCLDECIVHKLSLSAHDRSGSNARGAFMPVLPEHDIVPIVLTVEADCYEHQDTSVQLPSGIQVERTRLFWQQLRHRGSHVFSATMSPVIS